MKSQQKSKLNQNTKSSLTAIALDEASVTIIEIHGALGVLIALHRDDQYTFRDVVYFRLSNGIPSAKFIESIIIAKIGKYLIPQIVGSETYLYEPSKLEYQIVGISVEDYHQLANDVIAYRSSEVVSKVNKIFEVFPQFTISENGMLQSSVDYASALPEFSPVLDFLVPPEPKLTNQ